MLFLCSPDPASTVQGGMSEEGYDGYDASQSESRSNQEWPPQYHDNTQWNGRGQGGGDFEHWQGYQAGYNPWKVDRKA